MKSVGLDVQWRFSIFLLQSDMDASKTPNESEETSSELANHPWPYLGKKRINLNRAKVTALNSRVCCVQREMSNVQMQIRHRIYVNTSK